MDRLKIMAAYTPSKDVPVSDKSNLAVRGAKIFLPDEPDELHAAKFLMMLLQYIKQWGEQFPQDSSIFAKTYKDLVK